MKRLRAVIMAVLLVVGSMLVVVSPGAANGWYFSIKKESTGPAAIVAGGSQKAQFTITVDFTPPEAPLAIVEPTEKGPWTRFSDTLPDGLIIDSIPPECTKDSDTSFHCDWQLPTYAPASKAFVMTASASASLPAGFYTNCAYLQLPGSPPATEQDLPALCQQNAQGAEQIGAQQAGATVEVTNDADMQLTASAPGQVDPGKSVQLTWTATNAGPSVAGTPLTLTATLPGGVTFVSAAAGPWQCSVAGSQVTCTYVPPQTAPERVCAPPAQPQYFCDPVIVPGSPIPAVTWTVSTANPSKVASSSVQATVTSPTPDSKPANNAATPVITVTPVDLAVAKSAASATVVVDEQVRYALDVSNVGTIADLGTVTVVDTLPAGAEFTSAVGDGWTCTTEGQKVTCTHTHSDFPVGASEQITLVAKVTAAGSLDNTVAVSTTAYETNLANNTASAVVRVKRAAQTAAALPPSPRRILSGTTDQGQKLTTRVRCTPVKASVAGDVSYCKVRKVDGVVRVKVFGSTTMRVRVVQTAKGTATLKPFVQRKTYIVKP